MISQPPSKIGVRPPVGTVGPVLTVVPGPADADDPRRAGSSLIDEIVRDGARRMLAEAWQAEVEATSRSSPASETPAVAGWSCAMARISPARS